MVFDRGYPIQFSLGKQTPTTTPARASLRALTALLPATCCPGFKNGRGLT